MDLSNVRFSVITTLIGSILVVLSLGSKIEIGQYHYALIDSVWGRAFAGIIGFFLIGVGIYAEILRRQDIKMFETNTVEAAVTEICVPERFFYTLDDKKAESFPTMVQDAVRLRILGKTSVNLLGQYRKVLEDLGYRGCEIELLFVDPHSSVARYLYGNNPEIYRYNIRTAAYHLNKLKQAIEHKLHIRVTPHSPTFSLVIVERQDPRKSYIQVQLYFLHGAIGRDRQFFAFLMMINGIKFSTKNTKGYGVKALNGISKNL